MKSLRLYDTWPSYSETPCAKFDLNALNLIFDYLTRRKQRVKVNSSFSSYLDIFQGVPQGSILGSQLFNIFLRDLFLFVEEADIMNYADDNTCVFWKCWRNSSKTKGSRKITFWMVSKQFLKGKCWQMPSHFKCGWTLFN